MSLSKFVVLAASAVALVACGETAGDQAGMDPVPGFGRALEMNHLVQVGYVDSGAVFDRLSDNFERSVRQTITFDFNSAALTAEAQSVLEQQYAWLRTNRAAKLRLAGHTDLVGAESYNLGLGLRRAEAVAAYFVSRGIARSRLETVATFGESQPVVPTAGRERANRRVMTSVSGVAMSQAEGFDGLRADAIYTEYSGSADLGAAE